MQEITEIGDLILGILWHITNECVCVCVVNQFIPLINGENKLLKIRSYDIFFKKRFRGRHILSVYFTSCRKEIKLVEVLNEVVKELGENSLQSLSSKRETPQ